MPHNIFHCRTAGKPLPDKKITIYCGSVLDYAIHWSPHGMTEFGVSERELEAFEAFVADHQAKLFAELDRLGIPYQVHKPHAENVT